MELISSASSTELLAAVGTAVQTTGAGLWTIVAAVIGIPLLFWAIKAIKGLFMTVGSATHNAMYTDPQEIDTIEYVEHRMRRADFKL